MNNIYVTGASGSVGQEMVRLGCKPMACDITDLSAVKAAFESCKPDVVINLAGQSDVNFCEKLENQQLVIKTNVRGAYNVALVAEEENIPVVLLSTDHIFNGKNGPYRENAKLEIPVNFYGQSKLAMEAIGLDFDNVTIVRTSHLFTWDRVNISLLIGGAVSSVPTFIHRSFMYLPHFAKALYECATKAMEMPKVINISGHQTISWYEFALAAYSVMGYDKEKVSYRKRELKDYDGAPRPHKCGLVTVQSVRFGIPQHSFLDGLKQMHEDHLSEELGYRR